MLNYMGEDLTEILEVNLFAFAYRLFHEDFSPIYGLQLELLRKKVDSVITE